MIEYKIINTNGYPISHEQLSTLGADGWQLIQLIQDMAYFSRPKPKAPRTVKPVLPAKAKAKKNV